MMTSRQELCILENGRKWVSSAENFTSIFHWVHDVSRVTSGLWQKKSVKTQGSPTALIEIYWSTFNASTSTLTTSTSTNTLPMTEHKYENTFAVWWWPADKNFAYKKTVENGSPVRKISPIYFTESTMSLVSHIKVMVDHYTSKEKSVRTHDSPTALIAIYWSTFNTSTSTLITSTSTSTKYNISDSFTQRPRMFQLHCVSNQPPSASPLPWTVPTGAKNAFVWLCL